MFRKIVFSPTTRLQPIPRLDIAARAPKSSQANASVQLVGNFAERPIVAHCRQGRGGKILKIRG